MNLPKNLSIFLISILLSCSSRIEDASLGAERPAKVFLPSDYDDSRSYPLVTLLHGFGTDGDTQNAFLEFDKQVDERQFILILPEGNTNELGQQYWNATDACCDFAGTNPDDKTYLISLVDEAIEKYNVDERKISFVGHSNGGFMAHTMACDYGERISAIVSLAGTTFLDGEKCKGAAAPSVLQIHGTFDLTINYDGAPRNLTLNGYLGAEDTAKRWASKNKCIGDRHFRENLNISTMVPGKETTVEFWKGCNSGSEVELWTIEGGSHLPSLSSVFNAKVLDFLLEHPKTHLKFDSKVGREK